MDTASPDPATAGSLSANPAMAGPQIAPINFGFRVQGFDATTFSAWISVGSPRPVWTFEVVEPLLASSLQTPLQDASAVIGNQALKRLTTFKYPLRDGRA